MDPICHTLVGASLGATGIEKKTPYGRATLIIAANLPDIDGISYFFGVVSYAVRRGVTHGIPAMIVLPVLLALTMRALAQRRSSSRAGPEASFRWLLILSAVGVASHPALDWLNNYGMRWLMPIVDRWFYGDTLFVVDWLAWTILIGGLIASRWIDRDAVRWFQRPACVALALLSAYIGTNYGLTKVAEQTALGSVADRPPQRLMASPVPVNPLTRAIVAEYQDEYRFASVSFTPRPRIEWESDIIMKGDAATFERARTLADGRWFLSWARFPYSVVRESETGTTLFLVDARYVRDIDDPGRNFGFVALEL